MSTRIISLYRVLTSLVPPVHNQGVSLAPLQGHALWKIFLSTTGSFFVCCITDFFPATTPSGGRFPVTFHLFIASSYHGWSQPSILSFQRLRPAMIHCFFLFMLLTVFLVLRCHSASSESSVLYKIFHAILKQNFSYFTSTWRIASSDLSKNKFIICVSSISHFSPVY